ncbi:MAG: two-component regulator propeller domain-containing protein [Bacteroidota bacterium]
MRSPACFLSCFLFCAGTYSLFAQNHQLRAYTLENGLPQSQVYDIVQDQEGYLWLGTQGGGLCSFDGDAFQVWNKENGLLSNYIHSLYSTRDTLFIGTNEGLSLKTRKGFQNFGCPQINQFFSFGNTLYLATRKGLFQWCGKTGIEQVPVHPEIDTSSINALFFDTSFFWVATNGGLWKLDDLDVEASVKQKLENNNFTSVLVHKGNLFASTFADGIRVWDTKKWNDPLLIREPLRINSLSIQNENELWVATDNEGISILDAGTFEEKQKLNTANGLRVPHVRKVIADSRSNIWIATSGGGFYAYFRNGFAHYDRDQGLRGNQVYAVHSNEKGVWASNSEAGLIRVDSLGIHPIPNATDFPEVKIKAITSDIHGNIWAGTDGGGLFFYGAVSRDSIRTRLVDSMTVLTDTLTLMKLKTRMLGTDVGFPSNWINDLHVDVDNTLFAATYSSGIIKFRYYPKKDSLAVQKIFGKQEGIKDLLIRDLSKDKENRLWYATKSGDLGYIKAEKVKHFPTVLNEPITLGTILFKNDRVFLGTAGRGIWWSDLQIPLQFKKLVGEKKVSSENINQLIFDDQGYLWAGTERGVDKILLDADTKIRDVFHFGRNDGFKGIETCLNAVDKDGLGNLWFGTLNGLGQYVPGNGTADIIKPSIHFQELEINHTRVDSIDIKSWTNNDKVLQLEPGQNQLTLTYRTIDLDHPNEIEYRFKLNETEWSPWSSGNRQNLVGLAYGPHLFLAQSRNYRWEESDPIQFRFHIEPPLFKKPWFQWALFGAVLVLLTLLTLLYMRRIRIRNKAEREHLHLQNHLLSLEQKALRLQMNPHFIFNVLNGIKAMGAGKPEKMNTTINSFAVLLRETLYNSRKDRISLEQEVKTLRHYISVEQLMSAKPFTFDIMMDTTPDPEEIMIPPMLIQPFVENAIRHGVLKGEGEGKLSIRFYTSKNMLYCTVTDNGPGIFESQKVVAKTDHQSMALTVTRERLVSIAGKDALHMEEIFAEDKTVAGTRIRLKIPLLTEY